MIKIQFIILFCSPWLLFSQNNVTKKPVYTSTDLYYEQSELLIAEIEKENKDLLEANELLEKELEMLRSDKRKLQRTVEELLTNNAILRKNESDLNLLKGNLESLGREKDELSKEISRLEISLAQANAKNLSYEAQLEERLKRNGDLEVLLAAKDQVIEDRFLEQSHKKRYHNTINTEAYGSVGVGSNYSGVGMSLAFKIGNNQGLGLHGGAGYMPDVSQTEGYYWNAGFSYYFKQNWRHNWYVDGSYHSLIHHKSGFEYPYAITLTCGVNIFIGFTNFGLKIAAGGLYTNGIIGNEYSFAGDLGLLYKF